MTTDTAFMAVAVAWCMRSLSVCRGLGTGLLPQRLLPLLLQLLDGAVGAASAAALSTAGAA